jgi:hypothetical protein
MKNKKIILILVVLVFCLISYQAVFGQKAKNLVSDNLPGDEVKLLKNGDQRFFISVGEPTVGIMKDTSNPSETDFWFVVLSTETNQDEAKGITSETAEIILPKTFDLGQNFPNPFNPSTTVQFQIPDKIRAENIRTVVRVYDVLGRVVKTLVDENLAPGFYTRHWDGLNDNGEKISSGVYFYSITAGDFRKTRGMLMLK